MTSPDSGLNEISLPVKWLEFSTIEVVRAEHKSICGLVKHIGQDQSPTDSLFWKPQD
jgi:hypothetical protein